VSVPEGRVCAGELSVEELKRKVREAHPEAGGRRVYPPGKVDVDTLETREEIVRAFWELTYVPKEVYETAVGGAHVLRLVKAGDVPEDPLYLVNYYLWACRAGLDLSVIPGLAEKCVEMHGEAIEFIHDAAQYAAAMGGHTDVLDLLASEFGAGFGVNSLFEAARWGHDAMIDHLVERYGVDPNVADYGQTALHYAAEYGRVRTVKHLVDKHNVDIHKRTWLGKTALDRAEEIGRTECAAYLRELTYTQLLAGEYRGDIGVELLVPAARLGDDAMIDLLLERYGVDPNGAGEYWWTALHGAAFRGRVRTVKHLVEKHNADIYKRDEQGETALDVAEGHGWTECAAVLRGYGATTGEPVEEEAWTESDDWDSDENSDADQDVM